MIGNTTIPNPTTDPNATPASHSNVDPLMGENMTTILRVPRVSNRKVILGAALAVVAGVVAGIYSFAGDSAGPQLATAESIGSIDIAGNDRFAARLDDEDQAIVDQAFDRFLAHVYAQDTQQDIPQDEPAETPVRQEPAPESFTVFVNPFVTGASAAVGGMQSAGSASGVTPSSAPLAVAEAPAVGIAEPELTQADADEAMDMLNRLLDGQTGETPAPAAHPVIKPVVKPVIRFVVKPVAELEVEPAVIDVMPMAAPEPEVVAAADPVDPVGPVGPVDPAAMDVSNIEIVAAGQIVDGRIAVVVNDSRIITTNRPFSRVAIAADSLASVQPISPTQLLVTARAAGTTQLVFWDDQEQSQTLLLQSTTDLRQVQTMLDEMLPGEGVTARDLAGRIGLTGTVTDLNTADMAMRIAASFGEVENFMVIAGKQQVSLRIRFAEVSRSAGKEFGVNLGFQDGGGTIIGSNIGQVSPTEFFENQDGAITGIGLPDPSSAVQLFGIGSIGGDPFGYYIQALRDSNLLRVLADPELTVISGEQGEFLAGGEIPIPVPQENGIALEYREYGVRLIYTPVVLGDGRIRLQVATEVSDLDPSTGVIIGGTQVPGILKRQTATVVELLEGQTLAISGLLESKSRASKSAVPLLGDLPIVGSLFRSVRYQRQETELVIMITPRLIDALDPDEVPLLPGATWHHPNDVELMLFGQLGGDAGVDKPDDADRGGRDDHAKVPNRGPALESRYAFTPATPTPSPSK